MGSSCTHLSYGLSSIYLIQRGNLSQDIVASSIALGNSTPKAKGCLSPNPSHSHRIVGAPLPAKRRYSINPHHSNRCWTTDLRPHIKRQMQMNGCVNSYGDFRKSPGNKSRSSTHASCFVHRARHKGHALNVILKKSLCVTWTP